MLKIRVLVMLLYFLILFGVILISISIAKALDLLKRFANSLDFQTFGELVNHVETTEKVVALTYDDGPTPPYTNQLLELLERNQIKATFFVIGKKAEKYPEIVQLILSKEHEVGNHSYSHRQLIFKNPFLIHFEIEKTDRILRQLGARQEIHFRAPYGRKLLALPYILAKMQKKNILWSLDSKDYEASSSEVIINHVVKNISPGSIILMHDSGGDRSLTIAATEILIKALQEDGYSFKTISELMSQASDIKNEESIISRLSNQPA